MFCQSFYLKAENKMTTKKSDSSTQTGNRGVSHGLFGIGRKHGHSSTSLSAMKSGESPFKGGYSAEGKTAAGLEYSYPMCVSSLGPNARPPRRILLFPGKQHWNSMGYY